MLLIFTQQDGVSNTGPLVGALSLAAPCSYGVFQYLELAPLDETGVLLVSRMPPGPEWTPFSWLALWAQEPKGVRSINNMPVSLNTNYRLYPSLQ